MSTALKSPAFLQKINQRGVDVITMLETINPLFADPGFQNTVLSAVNGSAGKLSPVATLVIERLTDGISQAKKTLEKVEIRTQVTLSCQPEITTEGMVRASSQGKLSRTDPRRFLYDSEDLGAVVYGFGAFCVEHLLPPTADMQVKMPLPPPPPVLARLFYRSALPL